jgi:protein-S-isoprenylcysteine O-methyltransferase Ste14
MLARGFVLNHFTLFRSALFLSCAGYAWILYGWLRPAPPGVRSGLLAALAQFWIGLWADLACVHTGAWTYRDLPFSIAGIPVDLHLDWSLLWGLGLVWLSDRWPGRKTGGAGWASYLVAWTTLTLLFDAAMAHWLLFLDTAASWWWAADLAFLTLVQGFTLWFYRSIGLAREPRCGIGALPPIRPYWRSLYYMSFFVPFFFVYFPGRVEDAARAMGFAVTPVSIPLAPPVLAGLAAILGAWALHEFATKGSGTPVPWDPPRRLVESGPYALVANPMQISGILLTLALLLYRFSWPVLLYFADVVAMVRAVFGLFEQDALCNRFGPAFEVYRRRVRRWLPKT